MMALPTKKRTNRSHFLVYCIFISCACSNVALLFTQQVESIRRRVSSRYPSLQMEVASTFNSTAVHLPKSQDPHIGKSTNSMLRTKDKLTKFTLATTEREGDKHLPDFFTERVPWETLLARNNILTVYTGCSIATWTYSPVYVPWKYLFDDCGYYNAENGRKGRDITPEAVSLLQPGDSIYVELIKLNAFGKRLLPLIKVDFVLITGQNHLAPLKPEPIRPPYWQKTFGRLTKSPHVTHWFMMNLDKHAYDPFHSKLHPFPYGLSHVAEGSCPPADYSKARETAYVAELRRNQTKDKTIFVGYVSQKSNPDRALVPQGKKLPPETYYKTMHESKYIISPDGDRPECYRHYEAIGLGTMPITQLHPHLYRHLSGNVVFNETKWNMTELEMKLPANPNVNRRLIYEEYWMEYVERVVGRPMRWHDPSGEALSSLSEITTSVMASISQPAKS